MSKVKKGSENMAKGKKTPIEDVYKIMVGYASTRNSIDLSKSLNIPESTIREIIRKNKDKEEFVKLCKKKGDEFIKSAEEIISKGTKLLNKRLDTAIDHVEELEACLTEIKKDKTLTQREKENLYKKINKIQISSLNEITTAIGTLYDKKALAEGKPTSNVKVKLEDVL